MQKPDFSGEWTLNAKRQRSVRRRAPWCRAVCEDRASRAYRVCSPQHQHGRATIRRTIRAELRVDGEALVFTDRIRPNGEDDDRFSL